MTGNPRFSPRLSPRLSLRFSPSYLAFVLHRLSGVLLALFLPFHFLVLGLAIEGEARLDSMLAWTEQPLVKFAEWGLVVVFSLHLILGLRVLLIEWAPWGHAAMPDQSMPDQSMPNQSMPNQSAAGGLRHGWIGSGIVLALLAGFGFIAGVL